MKRFLFWISLIGIFCMASVKADPAKEVVCFVYHRFGDSRYPTTNVSVRDFEDHLKYLVENNFQVLSFSEAIAYLKSDSPSRKTAVITIDDGYKSFFANGLPLLIKYKLPATLFINTKTVGGGDYMDWTQLGMAVKSNIEIGNHTHSHNYFLNEAATSRYKTFKAEIEESQAVIDDHLKLKPKVFSYPYGEFDREMKKIAGNAGFRAAAAQNSGVFYEGTDLFNCPRFPMSEAYAARDKFIGKLSTHALRVTTFTPENSVLSDNFNPVLTLTVDSRELSTKQFQCFVQGGDCNLKIIREDTNSVMLSVKAEKPFPTRRRTLYTITVRGKNGGWYWYSHLWINPAVK